MADRLDRLDQQQADLRKEVHENHKEILSSVNRIERVVDRIAFENAQQQEKIGEIDKRGMETDKRISAAQKWALGFFASGFIVTGALLICFNLTKLLEWIQHKL